MQSHLNQQVADAIAEDRRRAARRERVASRSSDRSPPRMRRRVAVAAVRVAHRLDAEAARRAVAG